MVSLVLTRVLVFQCALMRLITLYYRCHQSYAMILRIPLAEIVLILGTALILRLGFVLWRPLLLWSIIQFCLHFLRLPLILIQTRIFLLLRLRVLFYRLKS